MKLYDYLQFKVLEKPFQNEANILGQVMTDEEKSASDHSESLSKQPESIFKPNSEDKENSAQVNYYLYRNHSCIQKSVIVCYLGIREIARCTCAKVNFLCPHFAMGGYNVTQVFYEKIFKLIQ